MDAVYETRLSDLIEEDIERAFIDGRIKPGQDTYAPRIHLNGIPFEKEWEVDGIPVEEDLEMPTSLGTAYFNEGENGRLACIIMIDSGNGVSVNGERKKSVRELDEEYFGMRTKLFRKPRYVRASTRQYPVHCKIPGSSSGGTGSSELSGEDLKLSKKKKVSKKDLERIEKEENARRNSRKTD